MALLAFMDPSGDRERRFDGALLIASAITDINLLRSALYKRQGE